MKPLSIFLIALIATLLVAAHLTPRAASAQTPSHAALIEIDSAIHPVAGRFLERGLETAAQDGAQFVIIRLDTPGGLLSTTREMVTAILESPIPVVVYVAPSGVHAASAGTFILAAAQVAAMAPATNVGAASPVGASGEDLPDTIKSKATEDAAAFLRGIATQRNRNADALERTVIDAVSYTETEALELGVIDILADDIPDLVAKLDGMAVEAQGGEFRFDTSGIVVQHVSRNAVEKLLDFVADPQMTFVLLSLGGILIIIELINPGLILPGSFGVIFLALAFLGLGNLPANWVGVGLILLGLALFYGELVAPGLGVLGISGGVSFVLGAFLLFAQFSAPAIPAPSVQVSIWAIVIMGVLMAGFVLLSLRFVGESKRLHYRSNKGTLVGDVGHT
ncbi:MAG: hypothetical protein QF898_10825, partial [SAR202 cluster bacterium]|nr:hypothetical protein [SAR202 cluster bacterium]